jgi:kynureninase
MELNAAELDARDPLAHFADEFYKPPGKIYLDSNSLGLLCKPAEKSLNEAIEMWRTRAIEGWTDGPEPWFEMSRKAARLLAPILGAEADDVMIGQSTTVNLHQLLATFHQPGKRIVIDEWSFPSDRYAIASHLPLRYQDPERDLIVVPDRNGLIEPSDLLKAMDHSVGMAVLPAVAYRSGQLLDMANLTHEARQRNVLIAWDCSHSAGVIPHRFRDDEIDLAFGCTYKYLNGGPGSPGWLYVHPRLRDRLPGLAGWFGSDPARQFQMSAEMQPASDAGRYMIGTPHALTLAPLLGSLELVNRAGVPALRAKSLALTRYIWELDTERNSTVGLSLVTPREDHRRGGHVTFAHPEARLLSRVLRYYGIIVDHRPPNLLRLAPAPLYTSFGDCVDAVDEITISWCARKYEAFGEDNALVT